MSRTLALLPLQDQQALRKIADEKFAECESKGHITKENLIDIMIQAISTVKLNRITKIEGAAVAKGAISLTDYRFKKRLKVVPFLLNVEISVSD
jgi:hypothetical protein